MPRPLALATSAALVLACVPPPPPAPERVRLPAAADVVEKHAVQILEEQKFDVIEHLSQGRIRLDYDEYRNALVPFVADADMERARPWLDCSDPRDIGMAQHVALFLWLYVTPDSAGGTSFGVRFGDMGVSWREKEMIHCSSTGLLEATLKVRLKQIFPPSR